MKTFTAFFSSLLVLLACCSTSLKVYGQINNPKNIQQSWQTDTSKHAVPLNELTILLKRNQIAPISKPEYIDKNQALKKIDGAQPVVALTLNNKAFAYPLAVLSYHEIVNDKIGNRSVSITYCPLCNSAIAFERKVKAQGKSWELTFGTSGMLRKSNLVMWDEETQTWWQQFTGKAIAGKLTGTRLTKLPVMIIALKNFLDNYPGGQVLIPDKEKDYTKNMYVHYDSLGVEKPRLFFEEPDKRLPAMTRVIDAGDGETRKVYPLKKIAAAGVINDKVGDKPIALFYDDTMISNLDEKIIRKSKQTGEATVFNAMLNGRRLTFTAEKNGFRDEQTSSLWTLTGKCIKGKLKGSALKPEVYGHHFAFAWFAFYPGSKVYKK